MIGLAGWRAFECFELGQKVCKILQPQLPEGITAQSGVSEVKAPEDFEAALDLASSMVSSGSDYRSNALSAAF